MKLPAIQWYSFVRDEVLDQLAELAAMQLRAAFTRRTHVADREALVVAPW